MSMQPRLCICCGQPMPERADYRSRHSHICAACAALVDEEEPPAPPKRKRAAPRSPHPATLPLPPNDPRTGVHRARLH